jgi:hypothetical protein
MHMAALTWFRVAQSHIDVHWELATASYTVQWYFLVLEYVVDTEGAQDSVPEVVSAWGGGEDVAATDNKPSRGLVLCLQCHVRHELQVITGAWLR